MTMTQGIIEAKVLKKKSSSRKVKVGLKTKKQMGIFDFIIAPFNEVASIEWVPGPYQKQIKAAKPIRLCRARVKKVKGRIKKSKVSIH